LAQAESSFVGGRFLARLPRPAHMMASTSRVQEIARKHALTNAGRRRDVRTTQLILFGFCALALLRTGSPFAWSSPSGELRPSGRRMVMSGAVLGMANSGSALAAPKEIPPGYVPAGLVATKAGETVVTPNGLKYECLEPGTTETGSRDGPPKSGSTVWMKFAGHINSPDGPVFDSSKVRGSRKPTKPDFVEVRLNLDPSLSNGMFEALKLMKVGAKGRFEQPPKLSYKDGKVAFSGDDELEVKEQIPAGATLYYDVELVKVVKP